MLTERNYQTRWPYPTFIRRGVDNRIECPMYYDGALVAPSSGVLRVIDSNGTKVIDDEAVTIISSIATYDVLSTDVPDTYALGDDWVVTWTLTMADRALPYVVRNSAALVRGSVATVPITDDDLLAKHWDLLAIVSRSKRSLQDYIEASKREIINKLVSDERKPYLIIESSALYRVYLYCTLTDIFNDATSSLNTAGKYDAQVKRYDAKCKAAWDELNFDYDYDDDGTIDDSVSANPPVVLGGIPASSSDWGYCHQRRNY